MIKKVLLVSVVFLGLLGQGLAQIRSLTLDEMFQLADQNNNRIRLCDLAISTRVRDKFCSKERELV